MGGNVALVSSALGMIGSVLGTPQRPDTDSQADALRAQREAQEEEQRRQEVDERKRERDKVLEAREAEKKRLATTSSGGTTLINGGAGLLSEPKVGKPGLKQKFGE